jgi:transposase-like protein
VGLGVAEQRHRAVLEVLDGAAVTAVARRYGVSRQTVHVAGGRVPPECSVHGVGRFLDARPLAQRLELAGVVAMDASASAPR